MTLPSSGEMKHSMIQAEFQGEHPIAFYEYYNATGGIPHMGTIRSSDFYGKSFNPHADSHWMTVEQDSSGGVMRTGFGLAGKTGFVHPESGGGYEDFGGVSTSVGVAGGDDLYGIEVANYAQGNSYYVYNPVSDQYEPTGTGARKHITITINNLSHEYTTWTWTKFRIFNYDSSGNYLTLYRQDRAFYRNNEHGYTYITFQPTRGDGTGDTRNFTAIYELIRTSHGDDLFFYFE